MKFLNRDDNVLTLISSDPNILRFEYSAYRHAFLFGIFACGLAAATWYLGDEIKKAHVSIYWFCCFLSGALFFGTITTIFTRCNLEVNGPKNLVQYSLASLFAKTEWEKNFNEFEEIRLYRPAASGGQAGRAATITVLLKTIKGDEIPLGTGTLGTYTKQKAKELAEKLSKTMSLKVIKEPSVERKR